MMNIVFLTTGSANSTPAMRMLQSLGWNLGGELREKFCELKELHDINTALIAGKPFDRARADAMLAGLKQPWAIKDPKTAHTLTEWLPALEQYRPTLLWVVKLHAYVKNSYKRRFPDDPADIDQRLQLCQHHFDNWPYGKLRLSVAQISDAVSQWNVNRCFSAATTKVASK